MTAKQGAVKTLASVLATKQPVVSSTLHMCNKATFARATGKTLSRSKELLQQISEKKTLEDELQAYEFNVDYVTVKKLEEVTTAKGVLIYYNNNEPALMHPIFKVHLLGKLVTNIVSDRLNVEKFIQTPEFLKLYESTKLGIDKMDAKALSNFILYSSKLKIRDFDVLNYAREKIISGNFRQISPQDLSHFLLAFGKVNYMDQELGNNIMGKLAKDQPFNIHLANRNLWACSKLNLYNKDLFDKFEQVLDHKKELLSETAVVNYLNALTKFNHISQTSKNILSREVIEKVDKYKYSSLASVCTSMVRIDWNHKIAMDIIKRELIKRFLNSDLIAVAQEIKPAELAQFFAAYTHFKDFDAELLTVLEQIYINNIEEAKGEESAAMLLHHAEWARDVLKYDFEGCDKKLREKERKKNNMLNRVEKTYRKYNHEFSNKILQNLSNNVEKLNIKAVMLMLSHLQTTNIDRNETKRIIKDFVVEGLKVFNRELKDNTDIDLNFYKMLLMKYYQEGKQY